MNKHFMRMFKAFKTFLALPIVFLSMCSIVYAESKHDNKDEHVDTKITVTNMTVCRCSSAKTALETKADEADKRFEESKHKFEEADKRFEESKHSDSDKSDEYKKYRDDAEHEMESARKDKDSADHDAEMEKSVNISKYGQCVCPNGSTSYNVSATGTQPTGNSTSAFREVRGQ